MGHSMLKRNCQRAIYTGEVLNEQVADEDGKKYGDEYFADLDLIEVVENFKLDYESNVEDIEQIIDVPSSSNSGKMSGNTRHPEFIIIDFCSTDDEASGTLNAFRQLKSRPASLRQKDKSHSAEISALSLNRVKNSEKKSSVSESTRALFGPDETCYTIDAKVADNAGRYFKVRIVLSVELCLLFYNSCVDKSV